MTRHVPFPEVLDPRSRIGGGRTPIGLAMKRPGELATVEIPRGGVRRVRRRLGEGGRPRPCSPSRCAAETGASRPLLVGWAGGAPTRLRRRVPSTPQAWFDTRDVAGSRPVTEGLARWERLELSTDGLENRCSIRLSYHRSTRAQLKAGNPPVGNFAERVRIACLRVSRGAGLLLAAQERSGHAVFPSVTDPILRDGARRPHADPFNARSRLHGGSAR